ncbi:hypothetical protein [Flavisericum labens]|uniref:hypothetical protein n=1 Tax=Flavisericum labens TaxID=3377112 RepID=UPI00387AF651
MKTKIYILTALLLFIGKPMQGQLLEKLKERAKEKGIKTSDNVSYDSTAYDPNLKTDTYEIEELELNSAKDFYNQDVVMALFNDGKLVQTAYFDADVIAMRTEQIGQSYPIFHDDKGKFYAYSEDEGQYKTMKLLPTSSMGFMTAGMTTQAYKLPHEPYFNALTALEDIGSGLNFLVLEMAFVYKPEHFKNNPNYTLENITCLESKTCSRYNYNYQDYKGSYIQFDNQDRLVELYIVSSSAQLKDQPTGKFIFTYKSCKVKLPEAVEQSIVPGPLGKILPIEKGLEPWKHNKKDKQ